MAPHLEPGLETLPRRIDLRTEIAQRVLFVLSDGNASAEPRQSFVKIPSSTSARTVGYFMPLIARFGRSSGR
jgi:hypothetical protein